MELALALAGAALAGLALAHAGRQAHQAQAALREGREHLLRQRPGEAAGAFRRGLALAEDVPLTRDLTGELRALLLRAEQEQAAGELHDVAERIRALCGAAVLPRDEGVALEAHCRKFWDQRDLIRERLGGLPGGAGRRVQADLLDLAVLWATLRVRLAAGPEVAAARREALEVLEQAEALYGPSCVLAEERRCHARGLGLAEAARAELPAPRTAWEHYALGRVLLREGLLERADAHLERAIDLQPQGLWPQFYKGQCAYRRNRHAEAVLAFTACVALAPERGWCFYNRGLAYEALGEAGRALRDYDRALRLDPALAAAALNRGMLHYRAGRHAEALADLQRALDGGADPAVVAYDQALVHLAGRDPAAARSCLLRALRHEPGHPEARALLDTLRDGR
jgi:tetratricopeptide (TPR) repeat protein